MFVKETGTEECISNATMDLEEAADCIFSATLDLEKARTVLQRTIEYSGFDKAGLSPDDRKLIGYNAETTGIMLNIVDDYMYRAVNTLEGKDGIQ